MYAEFSNLPRPFSNDDLTLAKLLDNDPGFSGHAVHTAEHLRPLLWACQLKGDGSGWRAVQNALDKFKRYTLPSGALIGDESLHDAPVPDIGYEYCTLTEMTYSLTSALQKLGACELGDWIENVVFNAAQGARLADGTGLDPQYQTRMIVKRSLYDKYKFNLVELTDEHIRNLDDALPKLLLKFNVILG